MLMLAGGLLVSCGKMETGESTTRLPDGKYPLRLTAEVAQPHPRAGGFHKVGFEGGQMPMYRRLPKRGFTSLSRKFVEVVRLSDLERLGLEEVDLSVLKEAGVVSTLALNARVILSGAITRKVTVRGLGVTKGARAAIEAAGGSIAE